VALALPAGLSAVPAAAVAPIGLVSTPSSWQEPPTGTPQEIHIVGAVQNNTAGNVTVNRINIALLDSHGHAFDTQYTNATIKILGPGEISPFELLLFPPPAGYDSFEVGTIEYSPATSQPYHAQLVAAVRDADAAESTFAAVRLINMSAPASFFMRRDPVTAQLDHRLPAVPGIVEEQACVVAHDLQRPQDPEVKPALHPSSPACTVYPPPARRKATTPVQRDARASSTASLPRASASYPISNLHRRGSSRWAVSDGPR